MEQTANNQQSLFTFNLKNPLLWIALIIVILAAITAFMLWQTPAVELQSTHLVCRQNSCQIEFRLQNNTASEQQGVLSYSYIRVQPATAEEKAEPVVEKSLNFSVAAEQNLILTSPYSDEGKAPMIHTDIRLNN